MPRPVPNRFFVAEQSYDGDAHPSAYEEEPFDGDAHPASYAAEPCDQVEKQKQVGRRWQADDQASEESYDIEALYDQKFQKKNSQEDRSQRAEDIDISFRRLVTPDCFGVPFLDDLPDKTGGKAFYSPRGFISSQPEVPAEMLEPPILDALTDRAFFSPRDLRSAAPAADMAEGPFAGPRVPTTMKPNLPDVVDGDGTAQGGLRSAAFDEAASARPQGCNEANTPAEANEGLLAGVQHGAQVDAEVDAEQGQGQMESPAPAADPTLVARARREVGLCLPDCATLLVVFSTAGIAAMVIAMGIEQLVYEGQL